MKHYILSFLLISYINCAFAGSYRQDTVFNQTDSKGLKQGYWKKQFSNGNLMYVGYFKNDKPVGEMKRYYESGGLKAVMHFNEKGDYASVKRYYENGSLSSEGFYLNSKMDSVWKFYSFYDKQLKSSETYRNGIKQGFQYHYFPGGQCFEKIQWKNDLKDGVWEQFFENGSYRLKAGYVSGKLSGTFIVYYPKGIPMVVGFYSNDLRDGKWVYYNENGTKSHEISYVAGKPQNEDELDEQQRKYFREIEENIGRYTEPDPNSFFQKNRNYEYEQ